MKKKTVRKLMKEQRRARQATPSFWAPAEFKDRLVRMFLKAGMTVSQYLGGE